MPILELTGTESDRFSEIRDRWITLSPASYGLLQQNDIYTVPLGQTFAAEVVIQSGSIPEVSGTISIKKDIHVFESELEAARFMNEIGENSISSVTERMRVDADTPRRITEIQLINLSDIDFGLELVGANLQRGFKIEVFASGSDGILREIQKDPEYNANDELVSDTYLKYFEIEEDK